MMSSLRVPEDSHNRLNSSLLGVGVRMEMEPRKEHEATGDVIIGQMGL